MLQSAPQHPKTQLGQQQPPPQPQLLGGTEENYTEVVMGHTGTPCTPGAACLSKLLVGS